MPAGPVASRTKPSDIYRRNMWVCMIEEPIGLSLYDLIGVDRILAETDYPHADTPFPHTQKAYAEVFAGIPADVVEAVSHRQRRSTVRLGDGRRRPADLARRADVAPRRWKRTRSSAMQHRHDHPAVEHGTASTDSVVTCREMVSRARSSSSAARRSMPAGTARRVTAAADAHTREAASMDRDALPAFGELPVRADLPPGSSWGVWGDHDLLGTLNLLTPERVVAAARSIRTGRTFGLNLELTLPDPPLFGRAPMRHEVTDEARSVHDDVYHGWNTQASSQWDGFRHLSHRDHGHYGGVADEEHGVHHWAARGIVGRAVLADVDRWRTEQERPLRQGEADAITVDDLRACLADQGTAVDSGDILLVRTGYITWYRSLDPRHGRRTGPRRRRRVSPVGTCPACSGTCT